MDRSRSQDPVEAAWKLSTKTEAVLVNGSTLSPRAKDAEIDRRLLRLAKRSVLTGVSPSVGEKST